MEDFVYLCHCLKCDLTLIDENPASGAVKHILPSDAVDMGRDEDGFPVCPMCKTDAYLTDL